MKVNYQSVLEDLRERRSRLDQMILGMEELAGEEKVEGKPVRKSGVYGGMTISVAAVKFLRGKGDGQSTGVIAKALLDGGIGSESKNMYRTVYNTLNTKLEKGEIVKLGSKWGLAEWSK